MKGFAIILGTVYGNLQAVQDCLKCSNIDHAVPGTCEYEEETFLWNSRLSSTQPGVVVIPKNDEEVQAAVQCAAEAKLCVAVRSGGHSYEGYWQGTPGGMVINLRMIKQIEIDCEEKTVTVGAGSLLGPVIAELWNVRGVLPHGLQPQIGMGGMTLGGGFGLLGRKYGLTVDRVQELKIVTADSKLLTVTRETNEDLFFALRGAGAGQFGVVTQFKYNYIHMPRNLTVVRYTWQTTKHTFAKVLGSILAYYDSNPTRGATHYLSLTRGGGIELGVTYSNKKLATHQQAMQGLECIVEPPTDKVEKHVNYIDAFLFYAGLAGKPSTSTLQDLAETKPESEQRYFKGRSGFLKKNNLSTETLQKLAELLVPEGEGLFVLIDLWGGKIEEVKDSAFVHRDIASSVQFGATDEANLCLVDELYDTLLPYFEGAYQNYMDLQQPDPRKAYYGDALDRLACIKDEFDPDNTFCSGLSLSSSASH